MHTKTVWMGTEITGLLKWKIGATEYIATDIFINQQGTRLSIAGVSDDKYMVLLIDPDDIESGEQPFDGKGLRYVEYQTGFCTSAYYGVYTATRDIPRYTLDAELEFLGFSETFHITLDINV